MKKLTWVVIALWICAWATPSPAEPGEGISNTFGINNTVGATRPTPPSATACSPYTENAYQLRGQVHAHSRPDKSYIGDDLTDNEFAGLYSGIGYDFLAQTNHQSISEGGLNPAWAGWVPRSVEMTYGPSPRDGHLIVLGTAAGTTVNQLHWDSGSIPQKMAERIRRAHECQALAFIAHPSGPAYGITANELNEICREHRPDAVSIYQAVSNAESKWDELLVKYGQPIWGYSEDDFHPDVLSSAWQGSTWVQVPGNHGSTWSGSGGIKEKVAGGNYYVSWVTRGFYFIGRPPELRVSVDNSDTYPVISAQVSNNNGWGYTTWFKTDKRRSEGSQYPCTGDEKYVRVQAEVNVGWGRKIQIRSQPIWIDPIDTLGSVMRTRTGRGILATSPELRLRYLSDAERPTPPDAGYIGHAFDVTTESGTCPPGAVLDLSYDGEDLSAIGGTQYLAIYRYDTSVPKWAKIGGTVDPGTATISSPITDLGYYTISADLAADTTAPQVFIDNPPDGGIVNMDTEVKATVNDDLGAYTVSFYMNDHPLAEDADALDGWSVTLPYAEYCEGDWTLKAVAADLAGNQGTAEIPIYVHSSTPPPTVSITSPGDGGNLSGTVTATGACWDDVAVASVSLYADDTVIGYGELDGSGGWTADIDTAYLANGTRALKAVVEDYPGNEAFASVSVTINNGAVTVGAARNLADGQVARVDGAVVTAGTESIGGAFYIEADDRSAGMRVLTEKTVDEGDQVKIAGVLGTTEGERHVSASDVLRISAGNPLPKPLGMLQNWFRAGVDSTGLLLTVWGRVTAKGDGYLYVDDGSALRDGTLTGEEENTGVRVVCDPSSYTAGDFLIVTGISSCFETPSGEIARRILTRKPEDVRKVNP